MWSVLAVWFVWLHETTRWTRQTWLVLDVQLRNAAVEKGLPAAC